MDDEFEIWPGDRVSVFDATEWWKVGHDVGNNAQFWKPATIVKYYGQWDLRDPTNNYPDLVDVRFDHKPERISCHLRHAVKPLAFYLELAMESYQ